MEKIGFILDNTSPIKENEMNELNISGIFNIHSYTSDGKELGKEISTQVEFYEYLNSNKQFGNTASPSIGEISNTITNSLEKYDKVFVITLSKELSSTYNNAVVASRLFDDEKVKVIDSCSIIGGSYHLVKYANELIKKENDFKTIYNLLEEMSQKTVTYVLVESFEALVHNGRIGKAKSQVASFLNIKAIISIDHNGINIVEKIRTSKKAIKKLHEIYIENVNEDYKVFIGDVLNPKVSKDMIELISNETNNYEYIDIPTIAGIHGGLGLLGLMFLNK